MLACPDVATLDEWQWIFDVNLFGMVRGIRTFTPVLKAQGSGRIVNVASLAGLVHPAGMASYNAVKAAVVALTETAGHELAAHGVTAHAVCPGFFRTNLMDSLQGADAALGQVMSRLVTESPISAQDVAAADLADQPSGPQHRQPSARGAVEDAGDRKQVGLFVDRGGLAIEVVSDRPARRRAGGVEQHPHGALLAEDAEVGAVGVDDRGAGDPMAEQ